MEEEIKKDLKDIKKEVMFEEKVNEETETKSSEKAKEIITPEKAEGLVEKLITSEVEEEQVKKISKKISLKNIGLIGGIILVGMIFLFGIWLGIKITKGDFIKKEKAKIESLQPEATSPESDEFKKFTKIVIIKEEQETEYPYKIELKNFLVPIGIKEFLKLDATLYFDKNASIEKLAQNEFIFREILYNYFKTISSETIKNLENASILEDKIKEKLKQEKVEPLPLKIKLEGVILKG